jgi:hypothetical protein
MTGKAKLWGPFTATTVNPQVGIFFSWGGDFLLIIFVIFVVAGARLRDKAGVSATTLWAMPWKSEPPANVAALPPGQP